ncbi:MAG: hypothetical protein KDD59_13045, partial [Bdellovibrionales bacterium]|nr:hypothetical protein [Bdellovibrionales bacterium]
DTLALIHRLDPKIEFVASGAPFEKDSLLDFQSRCANQGVTLHTALCSFEGAFSLIKRAKGIIVGDTCLKHMAAGSDAKVIELSLGSSHLYKTGAYKKNAVILQPKVSCLPCPHRNPCQFTEHMCAKNLVPEIVAPVVTQLLMNNWEGIRAIASEFADEIDVFRTFKLGGIWSAVNLADSQSAVEQALESVSWKFLLSRTNKINLFPFGSVGSELGLFFQEAAVALTADEFQEKARSLESRLMAQDEDLLKLQMNFSQKLRTENGDLLPFIKEYGDMALAMPWLQDSSFGFLVKESLQLAETKNHTDFSMIRRLQTIIEQAYEQNKIKLKLLRSVRMDDVEAR